MSDGSSGSRVTLPPSYDDIIKGDDGYLQPLASNQSEDDLQSPKHAQPQQQKQHRKQQQQQQQQSQGGVANFRRTQVEPLHVQTSMGADRESGSVGSAGSGSGSGSVNGSGGGWQQHLSPTKETRSPKQNDKVKMRWERDEMRWVQDETRRNKDMEKEKEIDVG